MVGGYTENDGTIDFYSRINTLINENSNVLDYGAGRGAWINSSCEYRKEIRTLKGKVKRVYACDLDDAIYLNKTVDEVLDFKNGKVSAPDGFFDIIIADYVLEHIQDPKMFYKEINRLLKNGGWLCARTPHKYNYVSIFASLINNKYHSKALKYIQPNRKEEDVFNTFYRLNTLRKINSYFTSYLDKSFIHISDPSYFFGNRIIFYSINFIHKLLVRPLKGTLFIYKQKIKK